MSPTRFHHPRIYAGAPQDGAARCPRHVGPLLVDEGGRILGETHGSAPTSDEHLPGAAVVPGFIDTHAHLNSLGGGVHDLELRDVAGPEDLLRAVREAAASCSATQWITGTGWQDAGWSEPLPTADELHEASGGRPVALFRRDRHALVASRGALHAAGIDAEWVTPDGGIAARDGRGRPTGLLVDSAMDALTDALPAIDASASAAEARSKALHMASLGVTCVHEAWTDTVRWAGLDQLVASGRLPIRVRAMLADTVPERPAERDPDWLRAFALKGFADGALGSRGAQLSWAYDDDPGCGLPVQDDTALRTIAERAIAWQMAVAIHAIGDRAVTRVLDLFESFADAAEDWRIEHAQMVRPEDLPRLASRMCAVQPVHGLEDGPWAGGRIGEERLGWSYRARTLMAAGARVGFGSDYPIESADPRLGLLMAEAPEHPRVATWCRGSERIERTEALRAYWSGAAEISGDGACLGRLAPGYHADFVCLSHDPHDVPSPTDWEVVATYVGGRRVFPEAGVTP